MITDTGIEECGYLVGGYCKAVRDKPVRIDKRVHDALKVLGCWRWNKYLDWSNNGRENTVPELPVKQVGDCRDSPTLPGCIEGRMPVPVHILQESCNGSGRDTGLSESIGRDIMAACDICGNQVVTNESDGHKYCEYHHLLWTKCWTHERMVKDHEAKK